MNPSDATTTARGEVAYPAPGAFPTDDLTPSVTPDAAPILGAHAYNDRQHGHNKLHKREDPRGWDTGTTQQPLQTSSRGHQYTDSGIGMGGDGPKHTDATNPMLPVYSVPMANNTPHEHSGNSSKPGVMTGAYTRIPVHDNSHGHGHGNTTGSNANNVRNLATTNQPSMVDGRDHAVASGLAATTATATGAVAHSPTSSHSQAARGQRSSQEPSPQQEQVQEKERNLVRNGRDHSSLAHKDPYWGDVPYGTGAYNTISGHGSTETPHVKIAGSTNDHEKDQAHEGVQGLGQSHGYRGEDARSPTSASKRSAVVTEDQHRAFPLTGHHAGHAVGEPTGDEHYQQNQRNFRFSEGLVSAGLGAGAAVGAGHATSELAGQGKDKRHPDEYLKRQAANQNGDADAKKASHDLGAGFFHRDHKDKDGREAKPVKHREVKEPTERDSKLPEGLAYHEANNSGAGGAEKPPGFANYHSKQAGAGGAALTAAGAAYGAHEYAANRGRKESGEPAKTHESSPANSKFTSTSKPHDPASSKRADEPEKKESKLAALFHLGHGKDKDKDKDHEHRPRGREAGHDNDDAYAKTKKGDAVKRGRQQQQQQQQQQHGYSHHPAQTAAAADGRTKKGDPFAAAGYQYPHPSTSTSTSAGAAAPAQPADKTQRRVSEYVPRDGGGDWSKPGGYGAAAAGAGGIAGAGYLAHKYAAGTSGGGDVGDKHGGTNTNANTGAGSAAAATGSRQRAPEPSAGVSRHANANARPAPSQPQPQVHPTSLSADPSYTTTATPAVARNRGPSPSSSSPPASPHYKVLASGTPSGIDVGSSGGGGAETRDSRGRRDLASASTSAAAPAASGTGTGTGIGGYDHGSGSVSPLSSPAGAKDGSGYRYAGAGAGAGAGALGAGGYYAARGKGNVDADVDAGEGGAARAVTHRCRKCGEENDISEYFRV